MGDRRDSCPAPSKREGTQPHPKFEARTWFYCLPFSWRLTVCIPFPRSGKAISNSSTRSAARARGRPRAQLFRGWKEAEGRPAWACRMGLMGAYPPPPPGPRVRKKNNYDSQALPEVLWKQEDFSALAYDTNISRPNFRNVGVGDQVGNRPLAEKTPKTSTGEGARPSASADNVLIDVKFGHSDFVPRRICHGRIPSYLKMRLT